MIMKRGWDYLVCPPAADAVSLIADITSDPVVKQAIPELPWSSASGPMHVP